MTAKTTARKARVNVSGLGFDRKFVVRTVRHIISDGNYREGEVRLNRRTYLVCKNRSSRVWKVVS